MLKNRLPGSPALGVGRLAGPPRGSSPHLRPPEHDVPWPAEGAPGPLRPGWPRRLARRGAFGEPPPAGWDRPGARSRLCRGGAWGGSRDRGRGICFLGGSPCVAPALPLGSVVQVTGTLARIQLVGRILWCWVSLLRPGLRAARRWDQSMPVCIHSRSHSHRSSKPGGVGGACADGSAAVTL